MEVKSWKALHWRYRFQKDGEVRVDIEHEICTYKGVEYTDLLKITQILSKEVLCKASKILKIDKGNGKFRYCYSPNDLYKESLQSYLPRLEYLLDEADTREVFNAFRGNYNPATNAKMHIGYNYTAKFDLKDFFNNGTRVLTY